MAGFRFVLLTAFASATLAGAGFRASAVKVDITPQSPQWLMGYSARQSTGVHDRIYHRVVAMESGSTQFFLVSSELCCFSPDVYDDFAQELRKETGIEARQVWWSVTHTHSAPEVGDSTMSHVLNPGRWNHEWDREYAAMIKSSLIEAVKKARATLQPARIGLGQGFALANINRRAKDVDGTVSLGLNPDGPADRQIGLIRLERPDGTPIALVVNYAIHGTVLSGKSMTISGDAPGVVSAYLEQKIGAPVLFVNGAAGDMAPIYSVYDDPKAGHLSQFRVLLGDRVLAALGTMGPATDNVSMALGAKFIDTPRKDGLVWPEKLSGYAKVEDGRALVRLPLRFLRINDTLIWSAPVEMLCEIAMAVRARSPFPRTFYFGYTNGWFGYLPTAKAFEEGGYEPKTSVLTGQAEADVIEGAITFMESMRR